MCVWNTEVKQVSGVEVRSALFIWVLISPFTDHGCKEPLADHPDWQSREEFLPKEELPLVQPVVVLWLFLG